MISIDIKFQSIDKYSIKRLIGLAHGNFVSLIHIENFTPSGNYLYEITLKELMRSERCKSEPM